MIDVRVDTHLRIPLARLTEEQRVALERELTIPNPDKERALREHVWQAAGLPDSIELWSVTSGITMVLPRGIADKLEDVLSEDINWDDRRVPGHLSDTSVWSQVQVRDYQRVAVEKMLSFEQGVYEAPAGSGKTVAFLEMIRRAGRRSLVIVDKTNIAEQWRERAYSYLGFVPGLIGDGIWDETGVFDIALQQTLWARRDTLGDWWSQFGLVGLDECHHVPANTFFDIIQRFPAYYRLGVSATPDKQAGREHLVRCALGPTFHETDRETLVRAGVIRNPEVILVKTDFHHPFWPTHRAVKDPETQKLVCDHESCDRKGLTHRNNYTELISALCKDDARNDLIADAIVEAMRDKRAILVLSKRLGHLDDLARRVSKRVGSSENIFRLSSKEKTEQRMEIYERAGKGNVVIFSTIADEALDIPRLDTLVLAFPTKQEGLIEQQLGRVARTHQDKAPPVVIDFVDDSGVLYSQLQKRLRVYRRQGLTMKGE